MPRNKYIQPEEEKFINLVTEACLKNDTSNEHVLCEDLGVRRYLAIPKDTKWYGVKREDGKEVRMICIFSEQLITNFHYKAGNDELSKPWLKKHIKSVIKAGEKASREIYK